MNIQDVINELAAEDPKFKRAYEAAKKKDDLAMRVCFQIERARIKRGLTQEELAKKMKTKQPSIARAESGAALPSLAFLNKMARALGTRLIEPRFAFMYSISEITASKTTQQITTKHQTYVQAGVTVAVSPPKR